mmetsp:Transcript_16150/g.34929  ORF Transcript_16150/g.34929 Transcript_16150/m.34929 type:complete len:407 (-) Transcript_16150:134-1354(-)
MVCDGCRASDHDAAAVQANSLLNLREDEAVPEGVFVGASLQSLHLRRESCLEELQLETSGLLHLGPQSVVDSVQQTRHGGEQSWAQSLQILQDLQSVALVEADSATTVHNEDVDAPFEDMGQRQVGEVDIVLAQVESSVARGSVGDQVLVGQQGALGVTGGARGIAEGGNVRGLGRVQLGWLQLAIGNDFVEAEKHQACGLGLGLLVLCGSLHLNNDQEAGALRLASDQVFNDLLAAYHRLHIGLVDDVGDAVCSQSVVGRHGDDGLTVAALLGNDPLRAVLAVEADEALAVELRVVGGRRQRQVHAAGAEGLGELADLLVALPHVVTCDSALDRSMTQERVLAKLGSGEAEVLPGGHRQGSCLGAAEAEHRGVLVDTSVDRAPALLGVLRAGDLNTEDSRGRGHV